MKKLNIALVGLGNIGSYLYKYLNENKKILTEKNNCLPVIKYISAKNKNKKRNLKIKNNQWLNNYLDATKKKDVDLIVELIGGSEGPAKKLVFNALKNKKHVVTAKSGRLVSKTLLQNARLSRKYTIFSITVSGLRSSLNSDGSSAKRCSIDSKSVLLT